MKRLLLLSAVLFSAVLSMSAQDPDYSGLTSKNHPRLFITDADMKVMRRQIANGTNPYLDAMHTQMMKMADTKGLSPDSLKYDPATAKVTLLGTMRLGLTRIVSAAYAYRFTKDKTYLKAVEMNINTVCDKMAYWNSKYDLERAEMALAMAIAYDWLYGKLNPQTKQKILDFMQTEIFSKFKDSGFYRMTNNWNHVCNCCVTCAALSTYEVWPQQATSLIEKSAKSNPVGMKGIYAPEGASPEGPGYWSYATSFEGAYLMALKDCLGTDFGLSESEGFDKTLKYWAYCINGFGLYYNYSDCGLKASVSSGAWYCAWRFSDPSLLFREVSVLMDKEAKLFQGNRMLFLAMACAYRLGKFTCAPPEEHVYKANGQVPVAIMRRGWNKNDAYLGIKGGTPKSSHAHMDQGSFVYDRDGVRWIAEYPYQAYEKYRRMFKKEGSPTGLFTYSQDSWRWHVFAYHPNRHSTLTLENTLMDVSGFAEILSAEDKNGRLTASVDMSDFYFGKLNNVTRTVSITETDDLEVVDHVEVGDEDVNLRWSFVSPAEPSVSDEGITLVKEGKSMLLETTAPGVEYKIWPNEPSLYDTPISKYEKPIKGFNLAGYVFTLKAGQKVDIVTTLKRK